MTIVTHELNKIHSSYQPLKYRQLIPCNCEACKDSQNPYFYEFNQLRERIAYRKQTIECGSPPYHTVNVLSLIDDVIGTHQLIEDEQMESDRKKEYLREIIKLQASRAINIEITGIKSMSENSGISIEGSSNVNLVGAATGGSVIVGDVSAAINQLPDTTDPNTPGIKELLTELQAAIADETSLDDDDKAEALEQVGTLAEAGQNPNDGVMKKAAKTAMKILRGTVASLPTATKLVSECNKLLPEIAKIFGLG